MGSEDLCFKTLTELGELLRRKQLSPLEATRATLDRIESIDSRLHSYITVLPEVALQQAAQAEQEITRGEYRGPLHGVPLAVKDLFFTRGVRTTCGSELLTNWVPGDTATVVDKLQTAGAVLLGKLSLTEFACFGYPPSFRPPVNPWGSNRWPGGSSSGSAVATAAGLCFGSLGSDTGGSIRLPAAVCGVVGIKPTYGRVSRHGVFPLAESLDHVGPMARTVVDAAVLLGAIAGFDPNDPTSRREPVPDYGIGLGRTLQNVRIGVDDAYCKLSHPEVSGQMLAAVDVLRDLGAAVRDASLPPLDEALSAAWVITTAELAAAHAKTFPSDAQKYGVSIRSLLEEGVRMRGVDYAKAHATRLAFRGALDGLFQDIDLLACPSWPMPAFELEIVPRDAVVERDLFLPFARFTGVYNLTGNPTISLPCGFTGDGLPVSLQLIGRHWDEALLCQAAHAYEQATPWHTRRPSL